LHVACKVCFLADFEVADASLPVFFGSNVATRVA